MMTIFFVGEIGVRFCDVLCFSQHLFVIFWAEQFLPKTIMGGTELMQIGFHRFRGAAFLLSFQVLSS